MRSPTGEGPVRDRQIIQTSKAMKRRNFFEYSLLFAVGCIATNCGRGNSGNRNFPTLLRFTVTDVRTTEELERDYGPFRDVLQEILQTTIELVPVNSQLAAASALQAGQIDLAWAGPSEYVAIRARSQAIPIVSLNRPNYYTTISVRADSGITSLEDLQGKKIDMEEVGANTAHLGGVKVLLDAGLQPAKDFHIVMSAQETIGWLRDGKVDAWSSALHTYQAEIVKEGASEADYPIIGRGDNFPGDIFVLGSKFSPEVVEYLQAQMLANTDLLLQGIQAAPALTTKFQDASFALASDRDYDSIREVYRALGQDNYLP
ncbi:phosphate/phosphite/phosphonate ABC transporter substrate-binding protein [Roseofilum casamattae]|uniref:PhnD/SsuA/transferrin family substrate-binding protein n=1 Tax=Roseofilum casamattae BLCC-M143 TaxID=3022442 RepID=A0ABT7C1I7_9CYAN|nr:PhnD/SsuA/transferrin family substrate-binding protein [Roseofilum casamattae]MDJ1185312.1 PhnD/SsuA/transferrin family substrate-binding protein [Roseofilum casamattae BLCC-M143]